MRDVIGPNLPQPPVNPYGEIIYGVNPSDQGFLEMSLEDATGFVGWCDQTWPE